MEVIFKKSTIEDLEEVINLCNEVFDENTSMDYAYKMFNASKDDQNQIYINGIVDGKIIAHTKLTIIPTMYENMGTYSIINHFCVKDEYRRHHIASKMLDEIVRVCKEMNCKSIKLWSKNFRVAAHSCYIKTGFELIDAGFFEKEV